MGRVIKSEGRKCGAKKSDGSGDTCKNPAGLGTDHLGWGKCKFHGGNSHSGQVAASRARVQAGYGVGGPVQVTPAEALIGELHRTAGHIQWIEGVIATWETSDPESRRRLLMSLSEVGYQMSALWKLYQEERTHIARVAKMALDAGVAERQVQLAEEQGRQIARVLQLALGDPDLGLTLEQRMVAPAVIRRSIEAVRGELEAG